MTADELIAKTKTAFDAFALGDTGPLAAALSDDIEWTFTGTNALSGVKRGKGVRPLGRVRAQASAAPSGTASSPTVSASPSSTPSPSTRARAMAPTS